MQIELIEQDLQDIQQMYSHLILQRTYQANYTLDLTGGWYDAGDHGKYMVNGGISTWTVQNQYERALIFGDTSVAPFADNTLNIPESGNGKPDILDESRYNVEVLLKMQVPAGNTLAGMAHHKAHDENGQLLQFALIKILNHVGYSLQVQQLH